MKTLRQRLDEYLSLRRSLGYKLRKEGVRLPKFLSFYGKQERGPYQHCIGDRVGYAGAANVTVRTNDYGARVCRIYGGL